MPATAPISGFVKCLIASLSELADNLESPSIHSAKSELQIFIPAFKALAVPPLGLLISETLTKLNFPLLNPTMFSATNFVLSVDPSFTIIIS